MDYLKQYMLLVNSRKNQRDLKSEKFFEIHHIVPICLGGDKINSENLVKLTYREHYIAHLLLSKIYPYHAGIQYALFCMMRDPHSNRPFTARQIETIKKNYAEFKSWHCKLVNPGRSVKSRMSAKKRMSSDKNPTRKNPQNNHTAKQVVVTFIDEGLLIFEMKKLLVEHLMKKLNRTSGNISNLLKQKRLDELGIIEIFMKETPNKPAKACVGRKWFTDGKTNAFVFPGDAPNGFTLGQTKTFINKRFKNIKS